MSEQRNQKRHGWSSWSFVRRGQVIGLLTCALVTIAMWIPGLLSSSSSLLDFPALLQEGTFIPGALIAGMFGKSGQSFLTGLAHNSAFIIYVLIVNSLLGLLGGGLIGGFIGIAIRNRPGTTS